MTNTEQDPIMNEFEVDYSRPGEFDAFTVSKVPAIGDLAAPKEE